MLKARLLTLAIAGVVCICRTQAASFANQVVSYDPGLGFASDYTGTPLTNSAVVLGEPSRINPFGESTDPFNPPYGPDQIASLGANGSLVVRFNTPIINDPANPYGIDFIIYGHAGYYVTNSTDPVTWAYIGEPATDGSLFTQNTGSSHVSVSSDGVHFYRLNPALAPVVDKNFPTDAQGDFHTPIDPALSPASVSGTLENIRALYKGSAGGAGYDISWAQDANGNSVYLPSISYVRVDELAGVTLIDGFSDVFSGTIITEDFTSNPSDHGWKIFGNANLYHWNSTNHNLEVTWDSSQTNSFFYHPLSTVAGKSDSFSAGFDLFLNDYTAGVNPNKSKTFEITLGFQNYTNVISPNFYRAIPGYNPNLAEFVFFPAAGLRATVWPSLWSTNGVLNSNGGQSDQTFVSLPVGVTMHVTMAYNASNQTTVTTLTTNGVAVCQINNVPLTSSFTDFRVDQFSIPNYSDAAQTQPEFAGSVLAHGIVSNLIITAPPPPVQGFSGQWTNGQWTASFVGQANWTYTLEGTADFHSWAQFHPR